MIEKLLPYAVVWAVMAAIVLGLAIYRRVIAQQEDDLLHIRDDEVPLVAHQGVIARKLSVVDRWGKILTAVTFAYGVVLAVVFVYWSWLENNATSATLPIIR